MTKLALYLRLAGQNLAKKTAHSTPVGTPIRMAPAVT